MVMMIMLIITLKIMMRDVQFEFGGVLCRIHVKLIRMQCLHEFHANFITQWLNKSCYPLVPFLKFSLIHSYYKIIVCEGGAQSRTLREPI